MKIIIITTKRSHLPSNNNTNSFELIPTTNTIDIWKRVIEDYVVYVTNCFEREDQAQFLKHSKLSDLTEIILADFHNSMPHDRQSTDVNPQDLYLIAHDGDLLKDDKKELHNPSFIKNGIYPESRVAAVNSKLAGKFPDGHIYIYQHSRSKQMFENFIHCINLPSFSVETISFALSLFTK